MGHGMDSWMHAEWVVCQQEGTNRALHRVASCFFSSPAGTFIQPTKLTLLSSCTTSDSSYHLSQQRPVSLSKLDFIALNNPLHLATDCISRRICKQAGEKAQLLNAQEHHSPFVS